MNVFYRTVVLAALTTLVGIAGCGGPRGHGPEDHGPYRFENGDRIDRDGHREARWCDGHHDDEGCRR